LQQQFQLGLDALQARFGVHVCLRWVCHILQ